MMMMMMRREANDDDCMLCLGYAATADDNQMTYSEAQSCCDFEDILHRKGGKIPQGFLPFIVC